MQTLDEMRDCHMLTQQQHAQIRAWIADLRTPEAILRMPRHLWRRLELASVLLEFDLEGGEAPPT